MRVGFESYEVQTSLGKRLLQILLGTGSSSLSLCARFAPGLQTGVPSTGRMTTLEAFPLPPNAVLPFSPPWSVPTMPSYTSLAKGITWLSVITFIELEDAAATLPDLQLRKLVEHRPS